jgi:hypothetical protein
MNNGLSLKAPGGATEKGRHPACRGWHFRRLVGGATQSMGEIFAADSLRMQ